MSERLGRNVYYGFEANSGDFAVIYEWSLHWNRKMGKFFTSQEKGKIENCKKQASRKMTSAIFTMFPIVKHLSATSNTLISNYHTLLLHLYPFVDPRGRK